ncbi:MAG: hypothetical protein J0M25_06775 [Flavobacteriales bacterium]|nr:hypothetical protein [Flavobacteriales bacterium]
MKKTGVLFSLLLLSCSSQKHNDIIDIPIQKECPLDGLCTLSVFNNKQLILLKDGLGGLYYDIKENKGTTVIHYQYNKTTQANLQDGHYREDVLFEIKNTTTSLNITDSELQQIKLIFGRHCFCKGQTGYFPIIKGSLQLYQQTSFAFDLEFETDKVPQLIHRVSLPQKK